MQKNRPAILAAIAVTGLFAILVIFVFGLWLGVRVPQWFGFGSATRIIGTAAVVRQVQTLSQLVTVKYVMEKIVIREDVKNYDVKWAFENKVMLVAHGIVKAGVDFSKLKPEDIKVSGKKISIRLPPPQITDAYLDDKQTRVLEQTTGLLRMFDKDLQQAAREQAVMDIHRAAREAGILKDADERAQAQVKSLFHQMGFEEVEFLPR